MAKMSLGSYTFAANPSKRESPDLMTPVKDIASVKTYSSIAVFSWGVSIVGKEITLKWEAMTDTQYQELLALYSADTAVVFNPQDGSGSTFNVEIMDLTGKYFIELGEGFECVLRKDVALKLLVLSEVS